jgi:GH15 family glucan-1,4-alpha-glucosidase
MTKTDGANEASLDLAAIGNCIVASLIDRRGRHVWHCYPRLDGDPIFSALINGNDPQAGFWDVELRGAVESRQHYIGNAAILVTHLANQQGDEIRITDFAPRFKHYGRIFRPAQLVRRIEPVRGHSVVRVRTRPHFRYGAVAPQQMAGSNSIRYIGPDFVLRLTTDAPLAYIADESPFVLQTPVTMILGGDEVIADSLPSLARHHYEETLDYWQDWARYLNVPFEWQGPVLRAALALKLCAYEETGAVVAALTTSIPEAPNSNRNWDYRFCWLRDAYFVVRAFNRLGATRTMEDFIRYIANLLAIEPTPSLKPLYPIVPSTPVEEITVPTLAGYRGMGPVRVGNAAALQTQNDSYGSVIMAAAQMFFDERLPNRGDAALFERLEQVGTAAARLGLQPDAGPWEFRGRQAVHSYSAVTSWAGCHHLAQIASRLGFAEKAKHWRETADGLRAEILERAWNPKRNCFVSAFNGDEIDASLLLWPELGFVAPKDPRFLSTFDVIEKQLRRGSHVMRYVAPDDFGAPESAFTVCSFWYVNALGMVGREEEAREILESLLASRNQSGFLSEDVAHATGELWGNLPQTYSMVGLIGACMRLSKSWEEGFWNGS